MLPGFFPMSKVRHSATSFQAAYLQYHAGCPSRENLRRCADMRCLIRASVLCQPLQTCSSCSVQVVLVAVLNQAADMDIELRPECR